ncbi:unnamed protein product [Linum tenue]|uniref:Uncharacterized protein n=1 Tax=Linum tenue TaxID=586396 RepID=A0AAV0LWD6_9ROSI|nr:unnamed protein product [Linum tenue]
MLFTTPIPSVDFRFRSLAWLWRNIEARPCLSFGVGIHGFLFMVVASTYNNEFIPGTLCFYNDGFMPKLYCGESLLLLTKSLLEKMQGQWRLENIRLFFSLSRFTYYALYIFCD